MGDTHAVYLKKEGAVATLFFNRPEKRNALNYEMWQAIPGLLEDAAADHQIKVLVIRGVDETAFAAGADISEFQTMRHNGEQAQRYDDETHLASHALASFEKPTIAMIQGFCVGGGCGLALGCDFRISDTTGRFGITPAKLGLVYHLDATKLLVDHVGPSKAKEILMTGRIIGAEEAYRIGLVDHLYDAGQIVGKTYEFAELIASRAQYTVRATKQMIQEILDGATVETEEMKQIITDGYNSDDYKEGVQAFLEKRSPRFKYS